MDKSEFSLFQIGRQCRMSVMVNKAFGERVKINSIKISELTLRTPVAGFAAMLFQYPYVGDGHAPIHCLAHVVDGK
jgi:hypothetical protein